MNIFDLLYETFKFDTSKPIRLFEAFSGIGTQYMALKRLAKELDFQLDVVGISEIDKYALRSYKAIHGKVKNYGGVGSFESLPDGIDVCSWSYPCQDLSIAGKRIGFVKGGRSNYGFVFLDTLEKTKDKPKVLLMENVRGLFTHTFRDDWREIQLRLENMGYINYADILNAKNYGVPQNRDRVFILSILGKYNYNFPKPFKLEKRLKDYLKTTVDEKYYLSDKMLKGMLKTNFNTYKIENTLKNKDDIANAVMARFESAPQIIIDDNGKYRKYTPKECWRLMGISDDDFEKAQKVNSNSQLYKQAGNAIVVDVLYHIFKQLF